jgi:predicted nuclease of predicted toxin-antitoxin system
MTMSTIKLYLDEDVWLGLADALRKRGFDVVHVYQAERGERSDADQLEYAAQEQRTILTHNVDDFAALAKEYFVHNCSHSGIVLSPQIGKSELVRRTLKLLQALSAEEIANAVRYLSDYR